MGFLSDFIDDVLDLPAKVVEKSVETVVGLPGDVIKGVQKAVEKIEDSVE